MRLTEQPRELLRFSGEDTDYSITFFDRRHGKVKEITIHIPFDDLPMVGELLNSFLQSNGINSFITEKYGN